jgi:hypothetical protein
MFRKQKCDTCMYCEVVTLDKEEGQGSGIGFCNRYPPVFEVNGQGRFPRVVPEKDWCGEHRLIGSDR